MANVEAAMKMLQQLKISQHDLSPVTFLELYTVLEAMREPVPCIDRAITRGQADDISNKLVVINKRLGELEDKIGGEKAKRYDALSARVARLEGDRTIKPMTLNPDGNSTPTTCPKCNTWLLHVGCNCKTAQTSNGKSKDTIEIDREIAEKFILIYEYNDLVKNTDMFKEIKRAIAQGGTNG